MALSTNLALALVLSARTDRASQAIDGFARKSLKAIEDLSKKGDAIMARGFANIEIGKQFLQPVTSLVEKAVSFEDAMAGVAKYADGAAIGTENFNRLSQKALSISVKMGEKAEDVANNMAALAAAGTPIEDLSKMAEKTVLLGKAFDILPAEAGEAYKMIQAGTKYSEQSMDLLMDAQNELTNKFGSTRDAAAQLVNFMKGSGASVSSALKMDAANMAAIGNTMRVLAIETGEAETTMRRFAATIFKGGEATKVFTKAGGGTKGFMAVMEAAKNSGNAMKWFLDNGFNEQSNNLAKLASNMEGQGGGNLKNQLAAISDKSAIKGSASKEAENAMKTNAEGLKRFNASLEALKITAGSSLLPTLTKLLSASKPFFDRIGKYVQENPKVVEGIMKAVAAFGAMKIGLGALQFAFGATLSPVGNVVKTLGTVGKMANKAKLSLMSLRVGMTMASESRKMLGMASVSQQITKGIRGVGIAFSAVSKVFLANPWILAITAIAVGVYLIIKHWDKIKAWFLKLWQKIKNIFGPYIKVLIALIIKFTPYGLIYRHWGTITSWFSNLWSGVKNVFSATWKWVKNLFLNYTPYGLVIKHWSKITDFFTKLWDKVKNIFKSAMDWIKNSWIGKFVDKMVGGVSGMVNNLKSSIDYAKNHSLDATINHVNGGASLRPQPIPIARNSNNTMSFAPVFNVTGGMDAAASEKMTAQLRRDFEKRMNDYQYQQKRKGL